MRERPYDSPDLEKALGITPAYAGKTNLALDKAFRAQDHPRVCGKDSYRILTQMIMMGSPPRMRERRVYSSTRIIVIGITPAYAGKTQLGGGFWRTAKDHPRVCGKDKSNSMKMARLLGSPPRMRERLVHSFPFLDSTRITPAYAGKTVA